MVLNIIILSYAYTSYTIQNFITERSQIYTTSNKIKTAISITNILKQNDQYQIALADLYLHNHKINVYINWQSNNILQMGDVWSVDLKLAPIYARNNDSGFNQEKWFVSNHIIAKANVFKIYKLIKQTKTLRTRIFQYISTKIRDLKNQGLLLALTFGDRSLLESDIYATYQHTNIAHIIAISGLHIGIAFGFGYILARLIQCFMKIYQIAPVFPVLSGFVIALYYSWLAGFSPPTLRALIAIAFIYAFKLSRCYVTAWQIFIYVITFLVILDPFLLLNNSFLLSISAVCSLIIWYNSFPLSLILWKNNKLSAFKNPIIKYLINIIHIQICFFIFFTPIQIHMFNGFSSLSFPINLIVLTIFSLIIIPLILFSILTFNLFDSYYIADKFLSIINSLLSRLDNYWLYLDKIQILSINILVSVIIILLIIYLHYKPKYTMLSAFKIYLFSINRAQILSLNKIKFIFFSVSSFIVINIISLIYYKFNTVNWQIHFFDVGQGLSVLITKNQSAILYDTGTGWNNGSIAKFDILPFIKQNALQLDYLILSHDDLDHIGGVKDIIAKYPNIKIISSSNYFNKSSKHIIPCLNDKHFLWHNLAIKMYNPEYIVPKAENANSCVISISDNKKTLLLTGDIAKATELKIAERLPSNIDYLQVPHHGSISSSSWLFLQKIQPKFAIISAGKFNQWHHPHHKIKARLQANNVKILENSKLGQISISIYSDATDKITTARNYFSPWYNKLN